MRIGIVHSGYEMLPLMQILSRYDHEWHIFCDWQHNFWGDKSNDFQQKCIEKGIIYLQDKVDVIIIPPLIELKIKTLSIDYQDGKAKVMILPLFETYLLEYVLKYSIVGKLGLLGEMGDVSKETEQLIHHVTDKYVLNNNQTNTKVFHKDFPLWGKAVPMRKYFLTTYGRRDWMVRKTLKYDLRYFHDAAVDTLIPLDWSMLFRQKIIKQRINWKKMRFHGLDAVDACFQQLSKTHKLQTETYGVTLHCTDEPTSLLQERKWMDMLGRGDRNSIEMKMIVS